MTETPGLGTWGYSHLLPGLPIISSSPSLFCTERSSCSDPDSLEEAAAQLSPQGRGVFRNVHVQFPLKALCTEVTFRVPSLHTGECECKIRPRPMATEPGWDPRSLGDPLCQWVRRVYGLFWKEGGQVCSFLWMRWDGLEGDGDASFHHLRPEGGDGVSTAAPGGTGEEGNLAWIQIWKSSYEGKKWTCLIHVGFFFYLYTVPCKILYSFKYM